jgi:hypothetical protein
LVVVVNEPISVALSIDTKPSVMTVGVALIVTGNDCKNAVALILLFTAETYPELKLPEQ